MATEDKKCSGAGAWLAGGFWFLALVAWVVAGAIRLQEHYGTQTEETSLYSWHVACYVGAILTLTAVALTAHVILQYTRDLREHSEMLLDTIRRMQTGQTQQQALLTQMSENLLLSDAVKSVAFREKDLMVLREAIQEDIRGERWDSARVLINELAERFGMQDEADELRHEHDRYRSASAQEKIDAAAERIESLWMIHRYDEAARESQRLRSLYPDNDRVKKLPVETESRRQQHKKDLLARYDQAVKANDFEQGVELLKLLDAYLTPSEAAALEESARGVFRGKLHNLGVQFQLAVTEKQWDKALQSGRQIISEFPNTRMAQEVRDRIKVLQQRANKG